MAAFQRERFKLQFTNTTLSSETREKQFFFHAELFKAHTSSLCACEIKDYYVELTWTEEFFPNVTLSLCLSLCFTITHTQRKDRDRVTHLHNVYKHIEISLVGKKQILRTIKMQELL